MGSYEAASDPTGTADIEHHAGTWTCVGAWTLQGIAGLDERLARLRWPAGELVLDGSRIHAFDTTGALLLLDTLADLRQTGRSARVVGLRDEYQTLLDLVDERRRNREVVPPLAAALNPLARLGRKSWDKVERAQGFLAFLGEASVAFLRAVGRPARIRWQALFAIIESAGLNAIPIVALLSFLIGVVIAYQGGLQLKLYGANIFIVELVSITMMRELAPLMTAIIVAGRTGSSFTAQIGTMNVTEEVDALRTLGIDPFDILVLPKLLGLLVALPLLTVLANLLGMLGSMLVADILLDVNFSTFLDRVPERIPVNHFLFGIAKTPAFAAVIALVGCYQGFRVSGGADSVGRQTTESVVQAIFLVIILDAVFAVAAGALGI